MRWVIACREQDYTVAALGHELAKHGSVDFWVAASAPSAGAPVGAVIIYDALSDWLMHRLAVMGDHPFVCAVSPSYADLHALSSTGVGFDESGVHILFTNCAAYGTRGDKRIRVTRMPAVEVPNRGEHVGTVLRDIGDRDFSLLRFVQDNYRAGPFRIYLREGVSQNLPFEPRGPDTIVRYRHEELDAYADLKMYVPAPRVTDYAGGVMPAEWGQAAACGCGLLLVRHPLFDLDEHVLPTHRSLTNLKATLNGGGIKMVKPEALYVKPDQFVNQIIESYEEWKRAAA
jgi:hypothetical protein